MSWYLIYILIQYYDLAMGLSTEVSMSEKNKQTFLFFGIYTYIFTDVCTTMYTNLCFI